MKYWAWWVCVGKKTERAFQIPKIPKEPEKPDGYSLWLLLEIHYVQVFFSLSAPPTSAIPFDPTPQHFGGSDEATLLWIHVRVLCVSFQRVLTILHSCTCCLPVSASLKPATGSYPALLPSGMLHLILALFVSAPATVAAFDPSTLCLCDIQQHQNSLDYFENVDSLTYLYGTLFASE